jgi:hypothetical protein
MPSRCLHTARHITWPEDNRPQDDFRLLLSFIVRLIVELTFDHLRRHLHPFVDAFEFVVRQLVFRFQDAALNIPVGVHQENVSVSLDSFRGVGAGGPGGP